MVKRNSSLLVLIGLLLLPACSDNDDPLGSNDQIELAPFQAMARSEDQGWDVLNRLLLIDDELVFWDRRSSCCDRDYHQTLFGETPEQILCDRYDAMGIPIMECPDPRYRDIFETIIDNLDEPDLGLGNDHRVERVRF